MHFSSDYDNSQDNRQKNVGQYMKHQRNPKQKQHTQKLTKKLHKSPKTAAAHFLDFLLCGEHAAAMRRTHGKFGKRFR